MCLIVVKDKKDASFSIPDFRASFGRNNDGTGIMYVEDGRVVVEKTTGIYKNHLDLYYKHMHRDQFVLHHRFATHGEKTEVNVHPFKILSLDDGDPFDLYMVHNGVIPMSKFSNEADKKLSDTHLFALEYMQPLMKENPRIIENKIFQIMLHDFVGGGNKLAFLRNDGLCLIFNKNAGGERNGCWLSNTSAVNGAHNTHNYGRSHGQPWTGYGAYERDNYSEYGDMSDYGEYVEKDSVWQREDGWQKNWKEANDMKSKAETTMSGLDINAIIEALNEYAGMGVAQLKELFAEEPFLVFDMINLLETKAVSDGLLNEEPEKVAEQLYSLLQSYSKKKAA